MWNLKFCQVNSNKVPINLSRFNPFCGQVSLEAIPNDNIPYWTCQVEASVKINTFSMELENATFSNLELKKAIPEILVFPKMTDKKLISDFTLSMTPLDMRPSPSVPDTDSDSDADILQTGAKQFIELNITELHKTGAIVVPVKNNVQGVKWNIHFELDSDLHLLGILKTNEINLKPNSVYEANGIFKIISFNERKPIIQKFKGQLTNDSIDKSVKANAKNLLKLKLHSLGVSNDEFVENEKMNIVIEFKVNKSIVVKKEFNLNWQILEDNSKQYSIH